MAARKEENVAATEMVVVKPIPGDRPLPPAPEPQPEPAPVPVPAPRTIVSSCSEVRCGSVSSAFSGPARTMTTDMRSQRRAERMARHAEGHHGLATSFRNPHVSLGRACSCSSMASTYMDVSINLNTTTPLTQTVACTYIWGYP